MIHAADSVPLHLEIFQHTIRIKTGIVNGNTGERCAAAPLETFAKSVWQHNFLPVIEGVPPKFCIPCLIQCFQRPVLFPKPDTEGFFAIFTVTLTAIFIIYVPAHHTVQMSIPFCKLLSQFCRVSLVNRAIWACILPLSKLVVPSRIVRPCHLRIFPKHPGRHCRG